MAFTSIQIQSTYVLSSSPMTFFIPEWIDFYEIDLLLKDSDQLMFMYSIKEDQNLIRNYLKADLNTTVKCKLIRERNNLKARINYRSSAS